jgi:peptide deformylase
MAILKILQYPDPALRKKSEPVVAMDDALRGFIASMFDTMYAAPGIGLAAPQVNHHRRVIVTDVSSDKSSPLALINPVIIAQHGNTKGEEGCLSVDGIRETVPRSESITVRYYDTAWHENTLDADGLLAICIQHEIDHLDGKLFVDYLSRLKQQRLRSKISKNKSSLSKDAPAS